MRGAFPGIHTSLLDQIIRMEATRFLSQPRWFETSPPLDPDLTVDPDGPFVRWISWNNGLFITTTIIILIATPTIDAEDGRQGFTKEIMGKQ